MSRPLSIAHITHNAEGGAGRAALRARDACRQLGHTSELICVAGATASNEAIQPIWNRKSKDAITVLQETLMNGVQWGDVARSRRGSSNTLLSIPYPAPNLVDFAALANFDVLHLHWTTWTVSPPDVRAWLDAGRAVVWTLHDAWAMTGGCHYPSGCEEYTSACVSCPQLVDRYGVVANSFADKLFSYGGNSRLHIVAPSEWIASCARASRILRNASIFHVPNPIDLSVFSPSEHRHQLRSALGFDEDTVVLIFGNHLNEEVRKGGAILRNSIGEFVRSHTYKRLRADGKKVAMLVFGTPIDIAEHSSVRVMSLGSVADDSVLADVYSMADVLCFPSIEDNYPNTIVEAMACGTPVIAFRTSGMATMVEPERDGLLVEPVGSPTAFADAIGAFCERWHGDDAMRSRCRMRVLETNDPRTVGRKLEAVYLNCLEASRGASAAALRVTDSIRKVYSHLQVSSTPRVSPIFLRTPLNRRIAQLLAEPIDEDTLSTTPTPSSVGCDDERVPLIVVSGYHEHHAQFAGPTQFLRYLSTEKFDMRHVRVPLGGELLPDDATRAMARDFASALGLAGYANQGNALLVEMDLLTEIDMNRPSVVHFVDGELCGWYFAAAAKRIYGRRAPSIILSLHQPPEILETMISEERLKHFDLIIALCEDQAQCIRRHAPDVPIRIIPHGIHTTRFLEPAASKAFDFSHRPMELLGVGHWLRDYSTAVAVVDRLNESGMACTYTIVSHNVNAEIRSRHVRIVEGISDDELLGLYHRADALLQPMLDATANNAILESMSTGLPVFASNVGGIAEMTAGAAVLLPRGDVDGLVQAVGDAYRQPERLSRMSRAGRVRALELDWQIVASQFERAYGGAGKDAVGGEYAS